MVGRLTGKVAIVTGAGRGIGKSVALCFASEGAAGVVVCDVNDDDLGAAAKEVGDLGVPVLSVHCDVSSSDDVQAMVDRAAEEFGRIDVLINNACWHQPPLTADELDEETFMRAIRSGLIGSWLCSKTAFRHLAGRQSAVVNFTSAAAFMGAPLMLSHAATKAGIVGLTYTLAQEWGPAKIRVNAVAPMARTPSIQQFFEQMKERQKEQGLPDIESVSTNTQEVQNALNDYGPPDERIAPVVAFLASDDARYVTGQVLAADGGLMMH